MQLSTISEQFGTLLDATRTLHPDEQALTDLEQIVKAALYQLHSYRLAAASPAQVQEYFRLLEACSHDLPGTLNLPRRQTLARQVLRLLKELSQAAAPVTGPTDLPSAFVPDTARWLSPQQG
ncbi:hypothetical protein [Hymenobacter rubripertinctus]|uniref:Uncharacterized protein n=1 Tax=Hymenobacter rubripertinctus TaxID=2029981 RepID=A0A418R8Y6_9BACT|nr:hypothetical protein [Hymenobacter rubripertinctus]RIY13849.1 hypothetical protein D0T11_01855 [Hymenobacter rubripertinctus]